MGQNHASAEPLQLTERFTAAVEYARQLHPECRKGSDVPYLAHLLGVASMVIGECGHVAFPVTEDMVIAALLHDAVEDHGGVPRLRDIEEKFGSGVAEIVKGCSDSVAENPDQKDEWEARKTAYLARLSTESQATLLVSAADKLYNARTMLADYGVIGSDLWKRFKRGRDQQLKFFDTFIGICQARGSSRIVAELKIVVDKLRDVSSQKNLSES